MVRIMIKCLTVEKAIGQLEYMKNFIQVAQKLEGQKLSGKNNLGNYTVQIDKSK